MGFEGVYIISFFSSSSSKNIHCRCSERRFKKAPTIYVRTINKENYLKNAIHRAIKDSIKMNRCDIVMVRQTFQVWLKVFSTTEHGV